MLQSHALVLWKRFAVLHICEPLSHGCPFTDISSGSMSKSVHLVVLWRLEVGVSVFRNLRNKEIHLCCLLLTEPQKRLRSEIADTPLPIASPAQTRFSLVLLWCLFVRRVSVKSKAPSPPGLKTLESSDLSHWYPGGPHLTMDQKENPIDQDLSLAVVLPDGEERMTTVHGRYCLSSPLLSSHIRDDYFCSWSEKSDFHSKHCIMRTGSHKHQLHFDWIKHIIFVFRSTDYMLPAAPACLPLSSDWLSVYLRCHYLSHSLVYKLCIVYKRPPSCSLVSWEITDRNPWWQD